MPNKSDHVVTLVRGGEVFMRLKDQWTQLWNESPDATEAETWPWQYYYWKHMVRGMTPIFVTAQDSQGVLAALGIFVIRRNPRTLLKHLEFLGEHDADYHLLLHRPDVPVSVGRRMFEMLLREAAPSASMAELSNMPGDSWTVAALKEALGPPSECGRRVRSRASVTYRISLPATMDEYWKMLSKKNREGLKYNLRRLYKDFDVEFRVPRVEAELATAMTDIEDIDRLRWGHLSKFNRSQDRQFLCTMIKELFIAGLARLFLMSLNGTCVAYNIGFQVKNRISCPYVACDFAASKTYSMGLLNNILAIEHCIAHGINIYDLTRGGESYKPRLGARLVRSLNVTIVRSSWMWLLADWSQKLVLPPLRSPRGRQFVRWLRGSAAGMGKPGSQR